MWCYCRWFSYLVIFVLLICTSSLIIFSNNYLTDSSTHLTPILHNIKQPNSTSNSVKTLINTSQPFKFGFNASECNSTIINHYKPTERLKDLPFLTQENLTYAEQLCNYCDESVYNNTLTIKMLEADKTLKHFWLDKNINTYFQLLAITKNSIIHKLPVYHLTWFGSTDSSDNFDYIHAASIISAANVTNGTAKILLHTNIPEKIWLKNDLFTKTVGSLTTIVYLKSPPEHIFGHVLRKGEHVSDVYRILLLLLFPGTYADLDMAMVHHYEPEFIKNNDKHTSQVHLGIESSRTLANGFILNQMMKICDISSLKESTIMVRNISSGVVHEAEDSHDRCFDKYNKHLVRWLYEWRDFDPRSWGLYSTIMPWALWKVFEEEEESEITAVPFGIIRPNWKEKRYSAFKSGCPVKCENASKKWVY